MARSHARMAQTLYQRHERLKRIQLERIRDPNKQYTNENTHLVEQYICQTNASLISEFKECISSCANSIDAITNNASNLKTNHALKDDYEEIKVAVPNQRPNQGMEELARLDSGSPMFVLWSTISNRVRTVGGELSNGDMLLWALLLSAFHTITRKRKDLTQ